MGRVTWLVAQAPWLPRKCLERRLWRRSGESGAAGAALMSGFDTNPFADPVDINPFQVGVGTGRPPSSPTLLLRRR